MLITASCRVQFVLSWPGTGPQAAAIRAFLVPGLEQECWAGLLGAVCLLKNNLSVLHVLALHVACCVALRWHFAAGLVTALVQLGTAQGLWMDWQLRVLPTVPVGCLVECIAASLNKGFLHRRFLGGLTAMVALRKSTWGLTGSHGFSSSVRFIPALAPLLHPHCLQPVDCLQPVYMGGVQRVAVHCCGTTVHATSRGSSQCTCPVLAGGVCCSSMLAAYVFAGW